MPIAPLPLDKVVDAFRLLGVVPHPRYPAPSVSLISDTSSPPLLATPTAGIVGSLFGLNPYSSTSFRRSSSSFFRCFRLLQKNIRARIMRATTATGTTTATAVFPAADRPPDALESLLTARAAALEEVDEAEVVDETGSVVSGGAVTVGVWNDVTTMRVGVPLIEADSVTTEVITFRALGLGIGLDDGIGEDETVKDVVTGIAAVVGMIELGGV